MIASSIDIKTLDPLEENIHFTLRVKNKLGIHARPALLIARLIRRYPEVQLVLEQGSQKIDGKDVLAIMMLAAGPDSQIDCHATGPGSQKLQEQLSQLFESQFEEEDK